MPEGVPIQLVLVVSLLGTYVIENDPVHISWPPAFGLAGLVAKNCGFQPSPAILGAFLVDFPTDPISVMLNVGFLAPLLLETPRMAL